MYFRMENVLFKIALEHLRLFFCFFTLPACLKHIEICQNLRRNGFAHKKRLSYIANDLIKMSKHTSI